MLSTNISPESSKVLERLNICGRKGKEKEGEDRKKKIREEKGNYSKHKKI